MTRSTSPNFICRQNTGKKQNLKVSDKVSNPNENHFESKDPLCYDYMPQNTKPEEEEKMGVQALKMHQSLLFTFKTDTKKN